MVVLTPKTARAVINVQDWIHTDGRCCRNMATMLRELGAQIRKNDVPVDRVFLVTTVLHPQAAAWAWKWESTGREFEAARSREFFVRRFDIVGRDAPCIQLETAKSIRIRNTDKHIPHDCRKAFVEDGYVDMYGLQYSVDNEFAGGMTWTTKRAEGYNEQDIEFYNGIMPALSTLIQLLLNDLCMYSILKTYLGNDPGTRVYNGSINRGDCITVRSVIWFSDIRGFSKLSGMLERDAVIALINDVFEVTDSVLRRNGGEVLKFLGDGVMAVFRVEDGQEAVVCQQAREAAEEVQVKLEDLRSKRQRKGLVSADMGIGLHYGDASYGNIGSPNRLDFTLIGPSVSLASRIEGLCSRLQLPVLASSEFVRRDSDRVVWKTCGVHTLKGIDEPVEVYGMADSGSDDEG